ncbi:MAG: hypothetical protein MZV64_29020 [Ignavibacteriales bacterium]|nr:hypothetical protein [Ignavibacteriales bacterium]
MIFIGDLYQLPPVVTGQETRPVRPRPGLAAPPRPPPGRPPRPSPASALTAGPAVPRYETPYFFSARVFAGARLRHGLHRAREGLPPERRRLHRPAQRHPQPLGRRHPARPPQRPMRSRVRPARRRVLHHADQHQRPGRRPQPREARPPCAAAPAATRASSTASSSAARSRPTKRLELKAGAQVMLLTNDRRGRWVNGTIGRVTRIRRSEDTDGDDIVSVELPDGDEVDITPNHLGALPLPLRRRTPTASSRRRSAPSPSTPCGWPGP